jgi:hypothetical protein
VGHHTKEIGTKLGVRAREREQSQLIPVVAQMNMAKSPALFSDSCEPSDHALSAALVEVERQVGF